ncbi:hypothetical protein ACWCYY_04725 [Kitasatospora sp. NPDC001664]
MAVPCVLRARPPAPAGRHARKTLLLLAAVTRRIADSPLDNTVWRALNAPTVPRTSPSATKLEQLGP